MLSKLMPWVKFIQPTIILALLALLAVQNTRLNNRTTDLNNERAQRAELAPILGAKDNWASIRTNARVVVNTNNARGQELQRISKATLDAKQRADQADAALRREQEAHRRRYAEAQKTIDELLNSKGAGSTIDEISKLPWTGWQQMERKKEDGWENPEVLRQDYNKLSPEFTKSQRTVRLVTYPSPLLLRQSFLAVYKTSSEEIGNIQISAFVVQEQKGICEIHVIDPKIEWNSKKRRTMGHELAHCIYGNWHG